MRRILLIAAIAAALAAPLSAQADNYGGVSAKTRAAVMKEVRRYHGWDANRIACIIGRESGFNPRAVNGGDSHGGSHGLGQANGVWARTLADVWPRRYTIKGGVEIMYRIWRASGYSAWSGGSHPC